MKKDFHKFLKNHWPKVNFKLHYIGNDEFTFYERRGVIIMKFMDKDDFEKQNVFGTGQANTAYAKYFIGNSFLNPLTDSKCGLFLANVTFEPGAVIAIPPEVKHWHGAKKDSWFSHIAAEIPGENTSNEWCEPVTDEEYNRLG